MQQKSESRLNFPEFTHRTDALAHALGIRVTDLPERVGISEDMMMGYRTGRYPISSKAWRKLEQAESKSPAAHSLPGDEQSLHEPQSSYGESSPRVLLNPAYASPPPEPTRAQIEARVKAFLDAAEKLPGGLGFASLQVKLHLNAAALEALQNEE